MRERYRDSNSRFGNEKGLRCLSVRVRHIPTLVFGPVATSSEPAVKRSDFSALPSVYNESLRKRCDSITTRNDRRLNYRSFLVTAPLPKSCSVGQLLDAWEMSVRQACAPTPVSYTPVPALGL
ncbi:unnamed protein product [Chrysodeixis includens]|uniref:Uncharacterized protein n=1 Tax=Chrysodeixis includens TaxID=689277 RepID=A0A9N8KUQ0_CHRIL|nr:unnamed protein product [Chrysodeixis includens]